MSHINRDACSLWELNLKLLSNVVWVFVQWLEFSIALSISNYILSIFSRIGRILNEVEQMSISTIMVASSFRIYTQNMILWKANFCLNRWVWDGSLKSIKWAKPQTKAYEKYSFYLETRRYWCRNENANAWYVKSRKFRRHGACGAIEECGLII